MTVNFQVNVFIHKGIESVRKRNRHLIFFPPVVRVTVKARNLGLENSTFYYEESKLHAIPVFNCWPSLGPESDPV